MTTLKLDYALNWLAEHPDQFYTSGRTLETTVKYGSNENISYRTWNEAKVLSKSSFNDDPQRLALRKPVQAGDSTIIHINVTKKTAHVIYNGADRTFQLKANDPYLLADIYEAMGYKRVWLTADVILLAKKIRINAKGLAA